MKQVKDSPNNQLKRQTLLVTAAILVGITILLCMRFYLMLFFPGTPQPAFLFKLFLNQWETFSLVANLLKSPLIIATHLLQPHLPPSMRLWFPGMPAATFMAALNHQPVALYKALYPGTVEWLSLLAIPFWGALLGITYQGYWYLKANMNVSEAMQESKAILSEYKRTQQPQTNQNTQNAGKSSREEPKTKPQEPVGQGSTNARTSERLSQTKKLPSNLPPVIVRSNPSPNLDQYKKEQGDLMVRDMIRQLQQENSSLQAQQKQLRSTFSQYFSPDVLHYLENNKGTFQTVNNEKHMISVLFCDIRGFSNYSLSASSEEIVKYLGEYFEIASHYVLQKHNGVISKLMGDGLMAYWGFPVPNADHAYIATMAALDILREVNLRNQTNPDKVPLNIGIGIATGEVIVGNIGSDDFKDFTLIGPSVNMAARLEDTNKTLGTSLLISDATYKALQGRIACKDCGEVELRGWQNTEHVYAPVIKKAE